LKIIVVGTPKTGNTWVRHLLSSVYGLPQVDLNADFGANRWNDFGARWIGQEHYHPTPEILEWAAQNGVVFVTPVRHPADVLVSLRHHVQNHQEPTSDVLLPGSMLQDGKDVFGLHTRAFVERGFYLNLHLSIYWLRGGWSHAIRYEDIWRDPVEALRGLTGQLVPVSDKRLRHAISACEFGRMQKQFDPKKKFVRKGGLNSWTEELPEDVQQLLATLEPYPAQFAALGYSMNRDDPANERLREPARTANPINIPAFSNGVPVAPILVDAFLDLPEELTGGWTDAAAVDEGSFYEWLTRPAAADPHAGRVRPVITELAYYLHTIRPDVRQAFPDPFDAQRVQFGDWFLFSASKEYGFAPVFGLPVVRSWAEGDPLLASRV
jgi:hypothetical protein